MTGVGVHKTGPQHGESIHLPASTGWPIVLAFGCTMLVGGLVTTMGISLFGAVLVVAGCIGWFRQVLPHEAHEHVEVKVQPFSIETTRRSVERLKVHAEHRAHLPLETYPIRSGIKGGIAGGIAMIFPAIIYGLIAHHSIWYPVNLLGGAGATPRQITDVQLSTFQWEWFLTAVVIQAVVCMLVGLLYGAMLPMLPRHPVLLGGILAPFLWTGLIHASLGIINPALDAHISWPAFLISQLTYGLVAGLVVARDNRVRTSGRLPFFARIGLEAPGLMESNPNAGPPVAAPPKPGNGSQEKH